MGTKRYLPGAQFLTRFTRVKIVTTEYQRVIKSSAEVGRSKLLFLVILEDKGKYK